MPSSTPPASHADLLTRPVFAHLATVRPDGAPQSNPMWFEWDGEHIRFTHTTKRQKYRNLAHERRVALSIADPDDPYRFMEIRGEVDSIEPDPGAAFYKQLQPRYGDDDEVTDPDLRVIVSVRPTTFVVGTGGHVVKPSE